MDSRVQPRHIRALAMMDREARPMSLGELFPGRTQNCMPKLVERGWATCTTTFQPGPGKFVITEAGRQAIS